MVRALLHTHDFQPRRCLRKELHAGDHTRALLVYVPAGELRSNSEKEFVHAAVRYKISEKSRASLVEQEPHREFIAEEFQDRGRSNSPPGASIALTSVEASAVTPFLASDSLPFGEVTIRVLTPGVRNTALWRSTAPLPLTITFIGGSGLLSTAGDIAHSALARLWIYVFRQP